MWDLDMCFQLYKITEQCYVQMNVYTEYSNVLFPCRLCLSTVFARLFIWLLVIVSNNVHYCAHVDVESLAVPIQKMVFNISIGCPNRSLKS